MKGPSVVPTRDEIDNNKEFSLRLYKVMENSGASTQAKELNKGFATFQEILVTISEQEEHYLFGSSYEGTYMGGSYFGQNFDQDLVKIEGDLPVVTKVSISSGDMSFLLLPDRNPGYVKLQWIFKGVLASYDKRNFEIEFKNTYHLKNDSHGQVCLIRDFNQMYPGWHRTGPASTFCITKTFSQDFVNALNCGTWPEGASEWLTRQRDNGWPTPDQIKKCESLGFLVVPAFHPNSVEKEFQWRISFTHQERLLVGQFNSVQLKCYILLKTIKTEIVNKEIPEETLTSYHCKTCMFYVMENTPNDFWVPKNLASCLIMCLRQIKEWVCIDNCPNYFIPEENMFDRITNKEHMRTLIEVLNKILNSDMEGLLKGLFEKVLTGKIGKRVQSIKDLVSEDMWLHAISINRAHKILFALQYAWKKVLENLCKEKENAKKYLRFLLQKLKETKTIGKHTETETSSVIKRFLPFLQLTLLSYNIVEKISAGESNKVIQEILEDTQWGELHCKTSCAKLKQASTMLMLGDNIKSLLVLLSIRNFDNVATCSCENNDLNNPLLDDAKCIKIMSYKWDTDIEAEECLRKIFTPCVPYFPDEKQIVPIAIKYEMIRAFGRYQQASPYSEFWYNLGIVDGKFLTLFLLYLNHKALGDEEQATKNLIKMFKLSESGDCTHRETCFNLLGWVFKERGEVDLAVLCFGISLNGNSSYNAAYWHLCFLICGY